jgi:hypothetical protein
MRRAKNIFYGILGVIIGIFLFCLGCYTLSNPGQVTCGGEAMSQGDTCNHYQNGQMTGSSDYTQQQQNNTNEGWVMIGVGALMFIGGMIVLPGGRSGPPTIRGSTPYVEREQTREGNPRRRSTHQELIRLHRQESTHQEPIRLRVRMCVACS